MILIFILTIISYFIQINLPSMLSPQKPYINWVLGSQDHPFKETKLRGRALRAKHNLKESLFVVLPILCLAIIQNIDFILFGLAWLGFRILYLIIVLIGNPFKVSRTIIWMASIACIAGMILKIFPY